MNIKEWLPQEGVFLGLPMADWTVIVGVLAVAAGAIAGFASFLANLKTIRAPLPSGRVHETKPSISEEQLAHSTEAVETPPGSIDPRPTLRTRDMEIALKLARQAEVRNRSGDKEIRKIIEKFSLEEIENSAINGNVDAMACLVIASNFLDEDEDESEKYINYILQAADQGDLWALDAKAELYDGDRFEKNDKLALSLMSRSAEGGHPDGLISLALAYQSGSYGLDKDFEKSRKLLERASEMGSLVATYFLGRLLFYHFDDEDAGRTLVKRAARGGFMSAKIGLVALEITPGFGGAAFSIGRVLGSEISDEGKRLAKELMKDPELDDWNAKYLRPWAED